MKCFINGTKNHTGNRIYKAIKLEKKMRRFCNTSKLVDILIKGKDGWEVLLLSKLNHLLKHGWCVESKEAVP